MSGFISDLLPSPQSLLSLRKVVSVIIASLQQPPKKKITISKGKGEKNNNIYKFLNLSVFLHKSRLIQVFQIFTDLAFYYIHMEEKHDNYFH